MFIFLLVLITHIDSLDMKRYFLLSSFILVALFTFEFDAIAQCAMCRSTVETNIREDGITLAAKLNTGILYLFSMPYLIAAVIGFLWYRRSRENRRQIEEAELRRKRIAGLSQE